MNEETRKELNIHNLNDTGLKM